jgi:hypothetical protein
VELGGLLLSRLYVVAVFWAFEGGRPEEVEIGVLSRRDVVAIFWASAGGRREDKEIEERRRFSLSLKSVEIWTAF